MSDETITPDFGKTGETEVRREKVVADKDRVMLDGGMITGTRFTPRHGLETPKNGKEVGGLPIILLDCTNGRITGVTEDLSMWSTRSKH